jgi:hypothetical protein
MSTGRVPTTANSPLTAKGDLFGYSTTQARVAVGSDGDTLVADSAASTGLRWQPNQAAGKNALVNGGMDIWQRGTSFTVASATKTFAADRWIAYRGASGLTASRQTASLDGFTYSLRMQRDSGNTSTASTFLGQNVEIAQAMPYIGKTITLSFWAKAGANFSGSLQAQLTSGTNATDQDGFLAGYTGANTPASVTPTLTTSWQRFTCSGTIQSTATQFYVAFTHIPSGTAGANDFYEVTGLQVELGSAATAFSRAGGTIQGELAACQRYYIRYGGNVVDEFLGWGQGNGSTQVYCRNPYPVTMRTTPTFGSAAIANFRLENGSTSTTSLTSVAISGATSKNFGAFNFTKTGATFTAGQSFASYTDNTTNGYLEWSAEL